jgi:hypothetical protein
MEIQQDIHLIINELARLAFSQQGNLDPATKRNIAVFRATGDIEGNARDVL